MKNINYEYTLYKTDERVSPQEELPA